MTIQITADEIAEDNQTFLVSGSSNNSSVAVGDALTVTIIDDDTATVTIGDNSTTDPANNTTTAVTVALQLDKAVEGGFGVFVSTVDGTATSTGSGDFNAITQQIDFNGTIGETKTLSITINGDNKNNEDNEIFILKIDSLVNTNASISISDIGTVTISDP